MRKSYAGHFGYVRGFGYFLIAFVRGGFTARWKIGRSKYLYDWHYISWKEPIIKTDNTQVIINLQELLDDIFLAAQQKKD